MDYADFLSVYTHGSPICYEPFHQMIEKWLSPYVHIFIILANLGNQNL